MHNGEVGESSSIELKSMAQYGTNESPDSELAGAKAAEAMDDVLSPSEEESSSERESNGEDGKKKKKKRETWDNKVQFLLSLIGYAVGLGNVWRFSYLCARNGGSAFLFPYLLMLFVLGIPLFYLELSLGQAVRKGPVGAWFKLSKNLGGIGIASAVVNSYISIYYNVIIAWVIFYFVNSFHKRLPWSECFGFFSLSQPDELANQTANFSGNIEDLEACLNESTQYYWYNNAVRVSDSINDGGDFNWQIFLCLIGAWVIIYLCLFRGIKSSGKIVYVTAIFPYLVLIALFFRAVTLPGAGDGLRALFLPGNGWTERVFQPQVWLEATTQIFFSLGVSIGALIALSSYTKPKYNTLAISLVVCILNSVTSIFASIIVFAVIGFKFHAQNGTSDSITSELVTSGPGLAFISFSEALIQMPVPALWAVLFFIMLFTLGLDSQFGALEGLLTVFREAKYVRKLRKELITAIVCVAMCILSIPFVVGNGIYLFQLFDQYAATLPLLFIGFFEFIAVGWVYGVDNFFNKLGAQLYHPRLLWLWRVMWKFVGPLVMIIIFFASIINEIVDPLQYTRYTNNVEVKEDYPEWAQFIGACIILSSALAIPVVIITRLIGLQSARDEALEALKRIVTSFQDAFQIAYGVIKHRRGNWQPQVDEDSTTPYERAGTPPLPAATVITSHPPPPSYQSSLNSSAQNSTKDIADSDS